MQVTTMANILKDAKIVKNEAKAIEVQEKDYHNYSTISIMEANIKPLSKEVTVMTMEDMDSHSTTKQVMWSSAFVVGDSIWTNLIITWLIAVNAVQGFRSDYVYKRSSGL